MDIRNLNKDEIFSVALQVNLPTLLNLCRSNKKINKDICDNFSFWYQRLQKDFDIDYDFDKSLTNIKQYYQNAVKFSGSTKNLNYLEMSYLTEDEKKKYLSKFKKIRIFNSDIDLLKDSNIISISFGGGFNQPVDNLPESVEEIYFGDRFNQPVNNLPQNLKQIYFGYEFDQSVDKLPQSLELISFGYKFNQPVDHLPQSLELISFGWKFNLPVDHLPQSLETLSFYYDFQFNQPVNNLPKSLKRLSFGENFNQSVDHLPESLEKLDFNGRFNKSVNKLPPCLKTYKIRNEVFENKNYDPSMC